MREFTSAVEDVEAEDARANRIKARLEADPSLSERDAEALEDDRVWVDFKLDGREMRAYQPNDGQLVFMMAVLGRGQSDDGRFAGILNIMFECLRKPDRDYIEGRLLSQEKDKKLMIKKIEEIFEYLTEEWFARPTQSASDSAP